MAGRLAQNVNGILYEVEAIRRSLEREGDSFSAGDRLVIERTIEKLEAEAERLARLFANPDDVESRIRVAKS